jgi:hypothetical protein
VAWQARANAAAAAAAAATPPVEAPVEPRPYLVHPKEYYEYELVGVVVHMGTADSGHYYSLIRERGSTPTLGSRAGSVPVALDGAVAVESTAAHAIANADALRASHTGEWFEFNDSIVQVRGGGRGRGGRMVVLEGMVFGWGILRGFRPLGIPQPRRPPGWLVLSPSGYRPVPLAPWPPGPLSPCPRLFLRAPPPGMIAALQH